MLTYHFTNLYEEKPPLLNHLTFCAKKFNINNWCAENINFLLRGPAKGTHLLIHSTTKISKQNAHLCATKSQELGHINWFISPVEEKGANDLKIQLIIHNKTKAKRVSSSKLVLLKARRK